MWIYRYFPKNQSLALGYIQGDNKKNRIYNNFANELNTSQNDYKIRKFIEAIMAPAKYTNIPHLFENRRNEINKISKLALIILTISSRLSRFFFATSSRFKPILSDSAGLVRRLLIRS